MRKLYIKFNKKWYLILIIRYLNIQKEICPTLLQHTVTYIDRKFILNI